MTKVLIFDRAPNVAQELADNIDQNILFAREAQLSLGVFAKLLTDGPQSLVRYSFVNPQTGYRYRSAGIMDEVHSAIESPQGEEVRRAVDKVIVAELGFKSLFGHDCSDCLVPIEAEPSDAWQTDQALRQASARFSPTIVLPTLDEVIEVSGAGSSSDYERAFFGEVEQLAKGLVVPIGRAA